MTEFHNAEYKALRSEIDTHIKQLRTLEAAVPAAVAGIYAWLVNKGGGDAHWSVWSIPAIVAVFGGFASLGLYRSVISIGIYLREVEKKFADKDLRGWETFSREGSRTRGATLMLGFGIGLWVGLLALTLLLPLVLRQLPRDAAAKPAAQVQSAESS